MKVVADLHVHSRYAMACSPRISINEMEATALQKGINLISTGDFTNPLWLKEIKSSLEEDDGTGLYKVKSSNTGIRFVMGVEVSNIFNKDGKTRKVHNCILLPSIESVEQFNDIAKKYGNLEQDGRPTLMMSNAELVEVVFSITQKAFVFPAHAWTPYFGVLGSISGFDSMEEAYEEQIKHIHALETGLSSDPKMNWRLSALDKYTLISNSDMHSLENMGREANVFEIERLSYDSVISAILKKDVSKFKYTIEFNPEEGKYHYDGHRSCNFSSNPETAKSQVCPICGKPLTIGVLHRVNELADRPVGFVPENAIPYTHLVPLMQILSYVYGKTLYSPVIKSTYSKMVSIFGTEFNVLTDADIQQIAKFSNEKVAEAIGNVRSGNITIVPGYDGVYGKIDLLNKEKLENKKIPQKSLFDYK
ncbi:MAG: endonuclease Q family protein [Candidatus Micrarchaeia archaeon]